MNGLKGLIGYVVDGKADLFISTECETEDGTYVYPITGQPLNFGMLTMADKKPGDQKRTA